MRKPVVVAMAMMLLQAALSLPVPAQTAAPTMPALTKDQAKKLSKAVRKQFEHCGAGTDKNVGSECLASAVAAHDVLEDSALEAAANQRACSFGNAVGCMSYGNALVASGDVEKAHSVWTSGPCKDAVPCQGAMFWDVAGNKTPDLAAAEQYGLPLCQKSDDDKVCKKLVALGSKFDYQAVVDGRKQRYIADLQSQASKSDLSLPLLQLQVSLNETNVSNQTGLAQLIARGELKLAQSELSSEQKNNAKLHSQLDSCLGDGPCSPPPPTSTLASNAH